MQQQLDRLASKAKLFAGIAGGAALAGVTALTAKSFESADALAKQADRLGTSTTALKSLQLLTELTGGSSENLSKSLLKAQKALGEFNVTGSGTAAPFLRQLNLDTKALAELKPDELFEVYAEQIRNLGSRSEQTAAAAALFGDRTGEMLNLIDLGASAVADIRDQVDRYGLALDRIDSAKIEEANDTWLLVRERLSGVGNIIAARIAPLVTAVGNQFIDAGVEAEVMGNKVDGAIDSIAYGAGLVGDIFYGWRLTFKGVESTVLSGSATIVGAFAKVEVAAGRVENLLRRSAGLDPFDLDQRGLRAIELSLEGSAEHAEDMLQKLAAADRPSVAIVKALQQARVEAQRSAEHAAELRDRLQDISDPTFDENERETRERESAERAEQALRDRLASKLATIEESLRTEAESEVFAFEQRQLILQDALEQQLVTRERALEIEAKLQKDHEARLAKIVIDGHTERQKFEHLSNRKKAEDVFATLEEITAGTATSNKTLFRINQAAAIANATINTYEGVTKTLAKYPWPLAGILAAVHLASGLAQIKAIASASPGGGTTPSAAGATPTFNDQPVERTGTPAGDQVDAPRSQVTIIVQGSLIGDEGVRTVIGDTLRELVDADEIVIDPNSRQAEEIRQGAGSGG